MRIGMIGLGRMGSNMARRLLRAGHGCVVFDRDPRAVEALGREGAEGASSLRDLARRLGRPRVVWMMLPAAAVDQAISDLAPLLTEDDVLVDGGNSFYVDDVRRARELAGRGIHHVDVGTSGGVWGLDRGYCLMIGGDPVAVGRLDPIFAALAPGTGDARRTPGRRGPPGPAERGYLHCGPSGGGHFVKMVHNGIEYGLMAAYAEGLNVLREASIGKRRREADAETTPLREPENYQYEFDLADVSEVWRRGSVIGSWLLDLTAEALAGDPELGAFLGKVSDSGEGRWTLHAAIDEGVPAPVLAAALHQRFSSRGGADFADRVLSAMRHAFGGHEERKP